MILSLKDCFIFLMKERNKPRKKVELKRNDDVVRIFT